MKAHELESLNNLVNFCREQLNKRTDIASNPLPVNVTELYQHVDTVAAIISRLEESQGCPDLSTIPEALFYDVGGFSDWGEFREAREWIGQREQTFHRQIYAGYILESFKRIESLEAMQITTRPPKKLSNDPNDSGWKATVRVKLNAKPANVVDAGMERYFPNVHDARSVKEVEQWFNLRLAVGPLGGDASYLGSESPSHFAFQRSELHPFLGRRVDLAILWQLIAEKINMA